MQSPQINLEKTTPLENKYSTERQSKPTKSPTLDYGQFQKDLVDQMTGGHKPSIKLRKDNSSSSGIKLPDIKL